YQPVDVAREARSRQLRDREARSVRRDEERLVSATVAEASQHAPPRYDHIAAAKAPVAVADLRPPRLGGFRSGREGGPHVRPSARRRPTAAPSCRLVEL